jgi:hypothetical protein
MKYCKWHNATSHDTNNCKILKQQIQSAMDQGNLKFEIPAKVENPMKIDQHPFSTNAIEVSSKDTSHIKLLMLESTQNKGVVDLKVQATAADTKRKGLLLEEEDMKQHGPVTSETLINKFQQW